MTTREPERPVLPAPEPSVSSAGKSSSPPPIPRAQPFFPLSNEATSNGSKVGPPPVPPRSRAVTIPPPTVEEIEEGYAQRTDASFRPEKAIDEQLEDLESWAEHNLQVDRWETARFWLLRGTAFLSAAAAAWGGALHLTTLPVAGGILAAVAVAIDAAWPVTTDRPSRRRALHDLRELQHTLKLKWDKVRLAYPDANTPKRVVHALALLDGIQAKRDEIGRYLGDAAPTVLRPTER
jgi:hypothetical protein